MTHLVGTGFALGRPLSVLSGQTQAMVPDAGTIVSPISPLFTTGNVILPIPSLNASGAWLVANGPFAVPFVLPTASTIYQLGWINGSAAGDNADIGIYDSSWNRLVSAGSTVASGSSAAQFVDVTDTVLAAGTTYYLVGCRDTTTANRIRRWNVASAPAVGLVGCYASSDALFPLPATLTGMTRGLSSWTVFPALLMAFTANV